ncbi:hypothetical protein ACSSV4_000625 [Roseovarius sp. MBR-154]
MGRNDRMLRYLGAIEAARALGGTAQSRSGLDPLGAVVAERMAILEGLARTGDDGRLMLTMTGRKWARAQLRDLEPLITAAGLAATPARETCDAG